MKKANGEKQCCNSNTLCKVHEHHRGVVKPELNIEQCTLNIRYNSLLADMWRFHETREAVNHTRARTRHVCHRRDYFVSTTNECVTQVDKVRQLSIKCQLKFPRCVSKLAERGISSI